jgi:hypothetical protein
MEEMNIDGYFKTVENVNLVRNKIIDFLYEMANSEEFAEVTSGNLLDGMLNAFRDMVYALLSDFTKEQKDKVWSDIINKLSESHYNPRPKGW